MVRKYFPMHVDAEEYFDLLPDEEAGKLIKAVFSYIKRNEIPDSYIPSKNLSAESMAFTVIKNYLDRVDKFERGKLK